MLAAHGRVVLPHSASGKIAPLGEPETAIAWADTLTVPVARSFLASGATVLVTRSGNPVCHGANLLRVAMLHGRDVGWITGVTLMGSGEAAVGARGEVTIHSGNARLTGKQTGVPRALFEYVGARRVAVCLWPDRIYTAAEFEMQHVGLMESSTAICGQHVNVSTDHRGRVWFESGVLDEELIRSQALDRNTAKLALDAMTTAYDDLADRIRSVPVEQVDMELLRTLGSKFFAHLLLFHVCYGEVMVTAAEALKAVAEPAVVLDIATTNGTSRWLYDLPVFQDAAKHGTPSTWWGVLPDRTVRATCADTSREIRKATGPDKCWAEDIEWLATMAVVKEMKMVLAKNLFAGAAAIESRFARPCLPYVRSQVRIAQIVTAAR